MLLPTDEVTVTMPASDWNIVMAQLAEGPFKTVAPLMQKIREQAEAQAGRAVTVNGETLRPSATGD
jgi:hypothetical protein